jgi:hypothetical protein
MRIRIVETLGFTFAALLAGCSGPTGPAGETGKEGPAGPRGEAGAPGAQGKMGMSAELPETGATIPVSCLSPCHGFNGVVAQFQTSVHYTEYLVNVSSSTPEAEWTATGAPCGNCHAVDGLEQRATGNVGTVDGGVVVHVKTGELQYRDPATNAQASAAYTGSATVAEVYCTTCHNVTSANDPHKTGKPWKPGSFPLIVSPDGGAINIEKSPSTSAVTGIDAGDFGPGNTCMWCHRSRVDITNELTATGNAISSPYWGPHEGPQGDLTTGVGGYQFSGQTYGESTHEHKLSCVDCHMANVADNSNVPDHSFNPSLTVCISCHSGATTFNVNGGQGLVQGELTQIEGALNTMGLLTRSPAAPYAPLTTTSSGNVPAQVGDGNWSEDLPVPTSSIDGGLPVPLSADQAGALYNYLLVARGGASGVHNPIYIEQLLYDSYFALSGMNFPGGRPELN